MHCIVQGQHLPNRRRGKFDIRIRFISGDQFSTKDVEEELENKRTKYIWLGPMVGGKKQFPPYTSLIISTLQCPRSSGAEVDTCCLQLIFDYRQKECLKVPKSLQCPSKSGQVPRNVMLDTSHLIAPTHQHGTQPQYFVIPSQSLVIIAGRGIRNRN